MSAQTAMKQQYYRLTILTRKVSMRFVGANGNETTILTPHVTNAKGKYKICWHKRLNNAYFKFWIFPLWRRFGKTSLRVCENVSVFCDVKSKLLSLKK